MAKFLFTVWPFYGHIHPNVAVAHALRDRGHEPRFYTGSAAAEIVEGEGFGVFPFQRVDEEMVHRIVMSPEGIMAQRKRPLRLRAMWRDLLIGTVPSQLADLEGVLDAWKPDVIVCDPIMWGPFLVLHQVRRIPVAMFSYTAACVLPGRDAPLLGVSLPRARSPFARLRASVLRTVLGLLTREAWRAASALRKPYGLSPLRASVTEFTGRMPLYIMPSTPEFDYQRADLPPSVHYVGPCLWSKPVDQPPPQWLDGLSADRPLVHVTEGTIPVKQAVVLQAAARGLRDLPLQVVMTTGAQREAADLGLADVPSNIRVERWVPLSDLLPRTDVVVTTGGSGTVLAALKEGIPLLVVPVAWDQPENAWRVVEAGAGLRLPWDECTPGRLRKAVQRLIDEPSFRDNARRLATDFARYRGPAQAAELLEQLCGGSPPGSG